MTSRRRGARPAAASPRRPTLVFTQGDPAGVGPELLLRLLAESGAGGAPPAFRSIVVAERAALERYAALAPGCGLEMMSELAAPVGDRFVDRHDSALDLTARASAAGEEATGGSTARLVDPVARRRRVVPGRPTPADAEGAMAALARGVELMSAGAGDALVTLPVNKAAIARHVDPSFRGHTDWLAAASGCSRYGRDYLMTFLAADLQVALLSTHLPLRAALDGITTAGILDALRCLHRHAGPRDDAREGHGTHPARSSRPHHPRRRTDAGENAHRVVDPRLRPRSPSDIGDQRGTHLARGPRIAVAGINPHAGEQSLLGAEDEAVVRPAVARARAEGIDASGPWSPDSLFVRARRGEFDWVLALYHDQGLIAVKTVSFGAAANWTLGLPWIRTSVDHGTAYDLAGSGRADLEPLRHVVTATLGLLAGELPRGRG